MIVGAGHDLQLVEQLASRDALMEDGTMFTAAELEAARRRADPAAALATAFSAKEAFFKAMPIQTGWCWSDLEIRREASGRPCVDFHGDLRRIMEAEGWSARVSISHSGAYVSTFVLIEKQA